MKGFGRLCVTVKPKIDLSRIHDLLFRVGYTVNIPVPVSGWPAPTVTWQVNHKDIQQDEHISIEVYD